jgi:hypothetical protein
VGPKFKLWFYQKKRERDSSSSKRTLYLKSISPNSQILNLQYVKRYWSQPKPEKDNTKITTMTEQKIGEDVLIDGGSNGIPHLQNMAKNFKVLKILMPIEKYWNYPT